MKGHFTLNLILPVFVLLAAMAGAKAAESFIIVDNQTGYILAGKNVDEKRQIASLTKVATGLVVLDWAELSKANLAKQVEVPLEALQTGGVNPVGLQVGDRISLRDLLYCALMQSDNVSAYALAYHIGRRLPNRKKLPPVENFVTHMNALARELEMKRTRFLNPSGLDSAEKSKPFSTASDMARLTKYAYSRAPFTFYVSQKTRPIHIWRGGEEQTITLNNTNQLLGQEEIDGVKTGRTAAAGDCLILSSDLEPQTTLQDGKTMIIPRRIIVVLLDSPDRFGEGLQMIRHGWSLYDEWAAKGRPVTTKQTL